MKTLTFAKRCAKEYGIECINQISDDSYPIAKN